MVIDVARNPLVARLLGRIEEIRRLASEHAEDHPARAELEARVDLVYLELAHYVHWLVRQDPGAVARLAEEGRRWAEQMDEELGFSPLPSVSDANVQVEDPGEDDSVSIGTELPAIELTADSRSRAVDVRDLGAVDPLPELVDVEPLPEATMALVDEVFEAGDADAEVFDDSHSVTSVDGVALAMDEASLSGSRDAVVSVATGSFEVPVEREGTPGTEVPRELAPTPVIASDDDADWLGRLRDVLDVIGAPEDLPADRGGRDALVRGLAHATSNLELRWSVFPDAVQQALMGLVGARARRLQVEAGADADVRIALGRMRRFAEERGLLLVPALRDGPPRDWSADERRYWTVLHAGM